MLLGAPTLKLRGDYLAIVTLGFGEIIRIFLNNLNAAVQHHQRPAGHHTIDPIRDRRLRLRQRTRRIGDSSFTGPIKYYYFLLARRCW